MINDKWRGLTSKDKKRHDDKRQWCVTPLNQIVSKSGESRIAKGRDAVKQRPTEIENVNIKKNIYRLDTLGKGTYPAGLSSFLSKMSCALSLAVMNTPMVNHPKAIQKMK